MAGGENFDPVEKGKKEKEWRSGMADGEIKTKVKPWFVDMAISLFLFLIAGGLALNGSSEWGWFFVGGILMIPTKSSF